MSNENNGDGDGQRVRFEQSQNEITRLLIAQINDVSQTMVRSLIFISGGASVALIALFGEIIEHQISIKLVSFALLCYVASITSSCVLINIIYRKNIKTFDYILSMIYLPNIGKVNIVDPKEMMKLKKWLEANEYNKKNQKEYDADIKEFKKAENYGVAASLLLFILASILLYVAFKNVQ